MRRKIVFLPYDFDTALGINNEGALAFGYNLEDTDHTASGAEIFNGQSSVLWNNLREAFGDELKAMYKDLRSKGKISYPLVEGMFEEHQSKWPEAIFNEDAWYKYLAPLVESGDASYLSMLQGSKEEQRKWWMYNRFRYIDSKYNAGDALSDVITIRAYAKSNVTVVPYADIYASVRYGSYDVQQRATRGQAYTLVCPVDRLNDTEVYIYSASQLASVGDLSGFKVGYANFSMATKLQSLKLGDADSEYENGNLTELYLGNNELLQTIDIRNCPNLTQPVDISGCKNIEYVYFDGTAITGLSLPNGGILKVLHVPSTLANLTILNQPSITDFTLPSASNVTTLRLENVSSAVDEMAILMALPAAARVRLIGFAWQAEDYAQVSAVYDRLDLMRGLDEAGGNVDTAQVMGTVHVPTLTMAQIASLRERHPDITVTYDHVITYLYYRDYDNTLLYTETITDGGDGAYDGQPTRPAGDGKVYTFEGWNTQQGATEADANATKAVTADRTVYAAYSFVGIAHLRYYTYDGATLLQDEEVLDGGDGTYAGTPARAADAQYTYTFAGWSLTMGGDADVDATKHVTADRNVYAAYSKTLNTYTVTFVRASGDGGGTLQTLTGVAYGTTPSYTGPTPTTTQGSATDYPFEGWTPALGPISGNTTYTAKFGSPIEDAEIADDWDTILANIANGVTASYKVGNYKPLDLGTEGIINMQIVAKDEDTDAEGNTAPVTMIGKELLATKHRFNPSRNGTVEGTGTIGGWEKSEIRTYMKDTIKPLIPANVRGAIKKVTKYTNIYDFHGTAVNNVVTMDDVWIPSYREVSASTDVESVGVVYEALFSNDNSRIKAQVSADTRLSWFLRSAHDNNNSKVVLYNGGLLYTLAKSENGVALGFCLGPDTIQDTWAEISASISDGSYSTKYAIGDTKMVDLGTEGKICMQIVAFDADTDENGNTVPITWVAVQTTAVTHQINNSGNRGGYPNSLVRQFVNGLVDSMPADLQSMIVPVTKTSYVSGSDVTSVETVWLPSNRELGYNSVLTEKSGPVYSGVYTSNATRIKKCYGTTRSPVYPLRASGDGRALNFVDTDGTEYTKMPYNSAPTVAIGFCTGAIQS